MTIQGPAIAHLIIEVIGLMLSVFGLIIIRYGSVHNTMTIKHMTASIISMLLYNSSLFYLEISQAVPGTHWRAGVYLAGLGSYVFSILALFIVSVLIVYLIDLKGGRLRRLRYVMIAIFMIGIAALAAAQLSGNLIHVDAAGGFSQGPASALGFVIDVVFIVVDIVVLLLFGQNIAPRPKHTFLFSVVLMLIAIGLRVFWPGIYIVAFASCLSMLFMQVAIMMEQTRVFRQQEIRNEQLKVDLMLGQIQPHFLFNVLYVIQEICLVDAELASKAIAEFSKYLRHNMDSISVNSPIPFKEELEHVRHYVSLQQLRFGDALDVRYELACEDFELPTLTLQPLVENAIRYGVRKSSTGDGTVVIRATEYPDRFEVDVIDDGPGFVPGALPDDGMSHTGLQNVRERLQRSCGGQLLIDSKIGEGTKVTMVLPKYVE